jgi:outer membrane biosynthesis protein TonB
MKARAKKYKTVQAFNGREFVAYEWRGVPDGNEAEAERLEKAGLLELQRPAAPKPAPKPKPEPKPEKVEEPVKESEPEPAPKPSVKPPAKSKSKGAK